MEKPWFDADSGDLLMDRYVADSPSYQRVLADDRIEDQELAEQAQRVSDLFARLEGQLPPEAHDAFTDAMSELAVLNALYRRRMDEGE